MGSHPLNLALRFLLELAALAALTYWGWTAHEGGLRIMLAIGLPLVAAVLWGTFRVPGDPGEAPVAVPGPVRLLGELALFTIAVMLLASVEQAAAAVILGTLVILHYVTSYDRIRWLLSQR